MQLRDMVNVVQIRSHGSHERKGQYHIDMIPRTTQKDKWVGILYPNCTLITPDQKVNQRYASNTNMRRRRSCSSNPTVVQERKHWGLLLKDKLGVHQPIPSTVHAQHSGHHQYQACVTTEHPGGNRTAVLFV